MFAPLGILLAEVKNIMKRIKVHYVLIIFTVTCTNVLMKYKISGTYYSIDEKKTGNGYHPLNSHITFFNADSFNYYFSWTQFLFISKGKYYTVNKKIILNTPDLPELLNSTEEVVDHDYERGQSWITRSSCACNRFGLHGNVGFLRLLFRNSKSLRSRSGSRNRVHVLGYVRHVWPVYE